MIIPQRFNGPPDTGNGGYTSGMLAGRLAPGTAPGAVEVTLHAPPPLEVELATVVEPDSVALRHGDALIATATPARLESDPVPPVTYQQATEISHEYPGFVAHPFPTCYTCGPNRSDGLRLFPGRLPDGRTAAPFLVPEDAEPATVWAALDCPGGWAISVEPPHDRDQAPHHRDQVKGPIGIEARPYVLGRITAQVDDTPKPGSRCVVTGQLLSSQGRKAVVATTVWGPDGRALATARATWIALTG
ncbi:MAG: hypothetical protein ACRDT1_04560 [Micromonosporaceae bacterium]